VHSQTCYTNPQCALPVKSDSGVIRYRYFMTLQLPCIGIYSIKLYLMCYDEHLRGNDKQVKLLAYQCNKRCIIGIIMQLLLHYNNNAIIITLLL